MPFDKPENQNLTPIEADRDSYQKANTGRTPVDVSRAPQSNPGLSADDLTPFADREPQWPGPGTFGGGDMQVPSIVPNDQIVTGFGDLTAGGFQGPERGLRDTPVIPGVLNRQPKVKGLP